MWRGRMSCRDDRTMCMHVGLMGEQGKVMVSPADKSLLRREVVSGFVLEPGSEIGVIGGVEKEGEAI